MVCASSIVTLQLGQCGNQIGREMFHSLSSELFSGTITEEIDETFFYYNKSMNRPTARAVLVDMEPKVIYSTLEFTQQHQKFCYESSSTFFKQSGSANNWAFGYTVHGPNSFKESVCDMIQSQVERCDSFGGFLVLQSLAGGTGSGVGAFLSQELRDLYPCQAIVNQVVWPFSSGEVTVQNYNSIFTLSTLQSCSDAIVVFENDTLMKICTQLLHCKSPSFQDMNLVVANTMTQLLLPCIESEQKVYWRPLQDWIRKLCFHPSFKMLSSLNIPQMPQTSKAYSKFIWQGLIKFLHQMVITDSKLEEGINWNIKPETLLNKSISNCVMLRGNEISQGIQECNSYFANPHLYSNLFCQQPHLTTCVSTKPFAKLEKSIALLSNNQSIVKPLHYVLERATEMYHAKAYLHQYTKYGLENLEDYFVHLEQVVKDYSSL